MSTPNTHHLGLINPHEPHEPITKDMFLELLLQIRKDSKELKEIGKQFCEHIKSR